MADINVIVLPDGTEYPVSDYYLPVAISNPASGQVLKYDAENQVWYNGEDTSGSSILYGTSAPTSQLGTDGCLYVKYTEGTGGASDTVDALYVKLDGAWCQISTGGGGGTSDYNDLTNKPQINSVELSGNKSLDDLGIQPSEISKTATGSIVTFSDGGDNIPVESFECEIVAQQASGTPMPDNPLLITGFSACDLVACGKNLIAFSTTTITTQTRILDNIYLKAGDYTFSIDVNNTTDIAGSFNIRIDTTSIGVVAFIGNYQGRVNKSFTLSQDSTINIVLGGASAGYSFTISNAQIEKGTTPTPYTPYTGTLYSIAFGQTIYGGKLIYANGKWFIRATFGSVDLGTLSWTYVTGNDNHNFNTNDLSGLIKRPTNYYSNDYPKMLCSIYSTQGAWGTVLTNVSYNNAICSAAGYLAIVDHNYTDAPAFKTAMNGVILAYELATPVLIPLTSSAKIKTLPGVNNIFSNTGDSTLKYFTNDADGIEELINTSETSAENTIIDDTNLAYEADNVQEAFEKITKSLTYAEYQALSEEEKNNGTVYFITDVNGDGQDFQPVIYSEEEREIGVWTDGRPLYEKTIDHTFTSGAQSYTVFASGIEMAFAHTRMVEYSANRWISPDVISKANVNNMVSLQVERETNGALSLWDIASTARRWIAVIRYTKTADAVGSGTWTPQGVPAVHYSEDEHVVGTWIDGRTLYEISLETTQTFTKNAWTNISDLSSLNIDKIIDSVSWFTYENGASQIDSSYLALTYITSTGMLQGIQKVSTASNVEGTAYITIRYTKSS